MHTPLYLLSIKFGAHAQEHLPGLVPLPIKIASFSLNLNIWWILFGKMELSIYSWFLEAHIVIYISIKFGACTLECLPGLEPLLSQITLPSLILNKYLANIVWKNRTINLKQCINEFWMHISLYLSIKFGAHVYIW